MRILTKLKLHTPSTSIRNTDALLNRKLERNSQRLRSAQDDLAKGRGNKALLQKRIMQLQAKESFLISTKDLKTKFMISPPEDFNETTDITAEKRKIYANIQNTVKELYNTLENQMHSTEGVTISMASKILGENLGITRSLLVMLSKELIPMAHDGTALQGYFALKRDLESLIAETQIAQKSLLNSMGKESVNRGEQIVYFNQILSPDQNDALHMTCKATKSRLAVIESLLEISRTAGMERISEEGVVTEVGKELGDSIKNSLKELLNAVDISRNQHVENESIRVTLPFLAEIDISLFNLSMEREGLYTAEEKIEAALGKTLSQGVMQGITSYPEKSEYVDLSKATEAEETKSIDSLDSDEEDVVRCCPFINCTSAEEVIEVLEKLATITLDDGTPAIDIKNLCALIAQSIKTEINVGQDSITPIGNPSGSRTIYKVGEALYDTKNNPPLVSNINFVGEKGILANSHMPYGEQRFYKTRDAYLLSVTQLADSFTGLIQSIDSASDLSKLLQHVDSTANDVKALESRVESPQAPSNLYSSRNSNDTKREEEVAPTQGKRIQEREASIESSYFDRYVRQITDLFEKGLTREKVAGALGIPEENSLFFHILNSDSLQNTIERSGERILKRGLPFFLDWVMGFPNTTVSQSFKQELLDIFSSLIGKAMGNISESVQEYVEQEDWKAKHSFQTFSTLGEFLKMKEKYRQDLRVAEGFNSMSNTQQDRLLELIIIQDDIYRQKKDLILGYGNSTS